MLPIMIPNYIEGVPVPQLLNTCLTLALLICILFL